MEFEELYTQYKNYVRHEVARWGVYGRDVEDVEQDAWLQISQQYHKFDFSKSEAWITSCVRNQTGHALRNYTGIRWEQGEIKRSAKSEGVHSTQPVGLFQEPSGDDPTEFATDTYFTHDLSAEDKYFAAVESNPVWFWSEVDKLDEKYSVPLTLRYYNEMDLHDIAGKTGVSYYQARRAIQTGIDKLRKSLNPGQESYPSAQIPQPKQHPTICSKNLHVFNEDNLPRVDARGHTVCRMCTAVKDKARNERKKNKG